MCNGRPNIILILIDDMGWKDLSCQGSSFYETPNIDTLGRDGVTFTNAYAACPVCSPTRASILSGKYPARLGLTDWIDSAGTHHPCKGRLIDAPYIDHLPDTEHSVAAALRDGGYQTWHVGKWHCGGEPYLPENHGFDVNIGGCHRGSPGKGGYFAPWSIPALADADVPEGTYLDDHLTDQALGLLRRRDREKPFFLNLWYYLVHTPIEAKQELVDYFTAKAREMGLDSAEALVEGERFPCEHKNDQRVVRRVIQSDPVYAAMVKILDLNVGRLLDALRSEGLEQDTLVIFTSDNGGLATAEGSPTCNAPLSEGKGWMYEGGTREPMLVRWPGVTPAGACCEELVTSPDFYPTLLEAAGLPLQPEQHCDGVSFASLLRDPAGSLRREAVYWHYPHYGNQGGTPACSMRMGDWKLIEFFETGRLELHDLREDIGETTDLSEREPDRTRQMHRKLVSWREEVNAKLPVRNPDFMPWRLDEDADPCV